MISILLKHLVHKENLGIQMNATVRDIIELMMINQKGVVVLLEDSKPAGIVTERDIVKILYKGTNLAQVIHKSHRKNLFTTSGERTIGYALNMTLDNNIRRIIITDDSGDFLGIITQQDLMRYLEEDVYRSTIKVKHILEKLGYLISVSPEDTLQTVLGKMVENKISAVAVIENEKAVGIVTEKDVLRLARNNISHHEVVKKYMSRPIITAHLDTTLIDIVRVMNEKNIRRTVIVNNDGQAVNIVTIRDVLRNLEGNYNLFLERKLKSAKDILNLLPEMLIEVIDTGTEQFIIWANEKVMSKFGNAMLDKPVTDFIPRESWEKIYSALHKLRKIENITFKREKEIYELSGFFVSTDGTMERGRFQLILRDITEDVHLSTTDPLTGVYNRRFINEFLTKEIERSRRSGKNFSVVICDLDDFKNINDTYGHVSGDTVLKSFCQLILDVVRKSDVVGRYGGDEFVIILPEASNTMACSIINRLRQNVEDKVISLSRGTEVQVTTSFGVSTYPDDGQTSEDLLIKTDERLYKAKSLGKNKVICIG